jgi:hypothetical protein
MRITLGSPPNQRIKLRHQGRNRGQAGSRPMTGRTANQVTPAESLAAGQSADLAWGCPRVRTEVRSPLVGAPMRAAPAAWAPRSGGGDP